MIKGVNKKIIEVLNPEDEYFERIIFFLNPNQTSDQAALLEKTGQYVEAVTRKKNRRQQRRRRLILAAELTGVGAVGAALALLFTSI